MDSAKIRRFLFVAFCRAVTSRFEALYRKGMVLLAAEQDEVKASYHGELVLFGSMMPPMNEAKTLMRAYPFMTLFFFYYK